MKATRLADGPKGESSILTRTEQEMPNPGLTEKAETAL